LTLKTGVAGIDRARWIAEQASCVAVGEKVPVTILTQPGKGAEIAKAFLDVATDWQVDSKWARPPGNRAARSMALLEEAPLEIGEIQDLLLSDVRVIVRRHSRHIGGHHVVMIDLGADWQRIPAGVAIAAFDTLSHEGVHIVIVAERML
jgi:hypothetical protein